MKITDDSALVVVDLQNDFLPGGTLAVPKGDEILFFINSLLPRFPVRVFTRDWHPPNHISFSDKPTFTDSSWPPHCVQGQWGAQFHPSLELGFAHKIVEKGTRPDREAYSGFQETDLAEWLRKKGVNRIYFAGLATDYCVKSSALDAVRAGFASHVILDAVRAVDVPAGSGKQALLQMQTAGIGLVAGQELR